MTREETSFVFSPLSVIRVLAVIAAFLVFSGVACQIAKYLWGHDTLFGLFPKFNLDDENTLPAFFSSALLLAAAALLGGIALIERQNRRPFTRRWTVLAFLFLALAADEAASLHELLADPLRNTFHLSGLFFFAWVIPGMLFALLIGAAYASFLFHLSSKTRKLFILGAFVYLSGVIGMEMIDGLYASVHGDDNLPYNLLVAVEESLEMAGVLIFLHALLGCLQERCQALRVRFPAGAGEWESRPQVRDVPGGNVIPLRSTGAARN
ncbi:MAG: hypothetical protein HY548_03275 [Elusimicrobia bacterium]|nr:hypothetical protein [Elusimicrobiota bacterium]